MSNTLVSVLVLAYNHEKYVQDTIKSIISQTYQNIELIIVDDGSKDNTWGKIQELQEECEQRFVRTYFETKENEGTCKTMNKLLDLANGEYVIVVASDDMIKSNMIEKEVDFLSKNPDYALVVGDNEIIDSEGKRCFWDKKRNITYQKNAEYKTFASFLQYLAKFNFCSEKFGRYDMCYLGNHVPNGYLIRKSIFEKIGKFTTEAPLEDWWLMLQISKYAKMKFLNEILFSYRWHSSNTIKQEEKMRVFVEKTKAYEEKILDNIDETNVLPIVSEVKNQGINYAKIGIPNVFVLEKWRKRNKKIKIIKLFNIQIAKWEK